MEKYLNMKIFWGIMILSMLMLTGCDAIIGQLKLAPQQESVSLDTELMEKGKEVYLAQYCGTCHALEYANTRGTFGPPHHQAGTNAKQRIMSDTYSGDATTAEEYLYESILDPYAYYTPSYETTNHHMPAYGHLPDSDIDALVYMLLNQK